MKLKRRSKGKDNELVGEREFPGVKKCDQHEEDRGLVNECNVRTSRNAGLAEIQNKTKRQYYFISSFIIRL